MKLVFKKKYLMLITVLFIVIFGFLALNNTGKNESVTKNSKGLKEYNYVEVQDGDDAIDGTEKVKFDAYFLQSNDNSAMADKYRGASVKVSDTAKLWIELKLFGDETLKDAYIEFTNTNVNISGALLEGTVFAETIASNNITRIPLKELSEGTTKLFYLTVTPNLENIIDLYSGTNKVTLKGKVVKDEIETPIEKEVEYEINFYGDEDSMRTAVEQTSASAPMIPYGSDETVTVTYDVKIGETKDVMLLKSTNFEAYVEKLNGFDPLSVSIDSASGFDYEYDETTNTLIARREATLNENNRIIKPAYSYKEMISGSNNSTTYYSVDSSTGISKATNGTYSDPDSISRSNYRSINKLTITVVYPNEASLKTGTAALTMTAWHEGFNNVNLTDEYISSKKVSQRLIVNYQCDDTKGIISTLFTRVEINKDTTSSGEQSSIDSTNIANGYRGVNNGDVRYVIDISPYIGGYNPAYPIGESVIYDLGSNYMNNNISMKQYEKYYSISLSSNIINYIGQQGYVRVIDADTNEIVYVFDKSNYTTPYIFTDDVRSIKLEISDLDDNEIIKNGFGDRNPLFNIRLTKEMNKDYIVNNVSYNTFKTWEYLKTTIRTDWEAGDYSSKDDNADQAAALGRKVQTVSALFTQGLSRVTLKVDTTDTKNQLEVTIDTKEITKLYKGYINGEFLIEIPDAILDYDVVEDTISYEKLEIGGHRFLKIKKSNTNAMRYQITFHLDVIPDVRVVNKTIDYKLYAYNPNCHNYLSEIDDIYDVNNNGSKTEKVGHATSSMNIIAPSEVITAATLENYNENRDITVSPMIAEVDPTKDNGDGKVSILVINNSGYAIKDIKVMGKIAFVGNKNQINGEDLNSEFDVQMTNEGIKIPDELVGKVTIYYSENENPTDDLTDAANGWTETPDFANVKTYMILINDYEIANQENVTFEYNISMPTDTNNLLKKAYFTHAVYFNVVTEAGLVDTSAGSTKLGIAMVRKYDLNIETLRKSTNKKVDYVTYEIEDEDGNVKTILPSETGIEAKGLYVGKEYKLRQVKISNNYEIDEEEKTFIVRNEANDELITYITGAVYAPTLTDNLLNINIENYPRYTVVLKNTDFDTDANISGSKFKITGKGYSSGYTALTDVNGELTFKNLYLNQIYTLQQVSATNYQRVTSSYTLILKYDDTIGEVRLCIYSIPDFTNSVIRTSDSYNPGFSVKSKSTQSISIGGSSTSSSQRLKGYIQLDLRNYSNDYTLTYYTGASSSLQYGHLDIYVTDYYSSRVSYLPSSAIAVSLDQTNFNIYSSSISNTINQAYSNTTQNKIPLKGGKLYYIYVDQYAKVSYQQLCNTTFKLSRGTYNGSTYGEYLLSDETERVLDSNNGVFQSLDNDLDNDQPIMNVSVKNRAIPSTKIKFVKKDVDTGALLPNAMYRLTGPGIVDSLVLTTDENGEAEANVYTYFSGDYTQAGYVYLSDSWNNYSLKEISAPSGYAIDSKPIIFRVNDEITCPTEGTCTKENAQHSYSVIYDNNNDNSFKETIYDDVNKTLNATVVDYPLVRITKKDKDTGELLPNTMFAIYKATKANGSEIISEALDINGNPVGDLMVIDGVSYRVITTDQNGLITLNLEKGQYKLKEVQASSEKYDISKQTYYFGVGESVPYQNEGMNYVKAYTLQNHVVSSSPSYDAINNNYRSYWETNDGGMVVKSGSSYIAKFDINGNLLWDYQTSDMDSNTDQCIGPVQINAVYPDKDTVTYDGCVQFGDIYNIYVTDAGEVFISGSFYPVINGNRYSIPTAIPYIRLNSDGTISSKYIINIVFNDRQYVGDSQYYNNILNQTETPGEVYMGRNDTYSYPGGLIKINNLQYYNTSSADHLNLWDSHFRAFATASDGGYYILIRDTVNGDHTYLYQFNADGDLIKKINVDDDIEPIYNQKIYIQSVSDAGGVPTKLNIDSEGNLLFVAPFYYNEFNELRIKYDKNLNYIYSKPTFYNDTDFPTVRNWVHETSRSPIYMKADGGYYYYAFTYPTRGDESSIESFFGDNFTNEDYFDIDKLSTYANNYYILEYDKNGKPVKYWNIGKRNLDNNYPETNTYVVKGIYSLTEGNHFQSAIPYNDGFIVAMARNSGSDYNDLTLATGEKIKVTGNLVVYYVNKDSRVEWLKQFDSPSTYGYMYWGTDNTIRLFFTGGISYLKDTNGNYIYGSADNTEKANVVVFEPSAEVLAAGPEAYSLDIKNEAKKFSIKVNSDEGSTYSVKNSNGQEVFNGSGEHSIETVTYEENSENEITITLLPGHVLKSVTLNGKDFTYQVNNDGTITLDKIPSVTENKVINIETEEKDYSVTVHHYLENTTDRIASDEILAGNYGEVYEAHPVVSNLYSLITDQDGNYIIPANASLEFQDATGDVIFYYKENEVELNVNYYVENTSDELKPTLRQRKLLGSSYRTEPAEIEFYELTGHVGEESGILNQNLTTVSYFYQEVNESTITVKHLDIKTNEEVAPTVTFTVTKNSEYTTSASDLIPVNYRYVSKTSNANDRATHENIEVIYYYEVIPFNVSVDKKIDKIRINGKDITISDSKLAKIEPNKGDEVIVYYEITLKNDGDIKAEFRVKEQDVDNFVIYDLGNFKEENGEYVLKETLEPGEEKTYKIGYKWEAGHYGKSKNKVELSDVENELGFSEPDSLDNISETEIIINVPTGMKLKITFIIIAGIIANGGLIMLYVKKGIRK